MFDFKLHKCLPADLFPDSIRSAHIKYNATLCNNVQFYTYRYIKMSPFYKIDHGWRVGTNFLCNQLITVILQCRVITVFPNLLYFFGPKKKKKRSSVSKNLECLLTNQVLFLYVGIIYYILLLYLSKTKKRIFQAKPIFKKEADNIFGYNWQNPV